MNTIVLGTTSRESQVISETTLSPNPANEVLNLSFNTADASEVTIRISDNLGKEVLSMNNTQMKHNTRATKDNTTAVNTLTPAIEKLTKEKNKSSRASNKNAKAVKTTKIVKAAKFHLTGLDLGGGGDSLSHVCQ